MATDVVFVDCETTGLDPLRHEIWELAWFVPHGGFHIMQRTPTRLDLAEPAALAMNGFYERRAKAEQTRVQGYPVSVWRYSDERLAALLAHVLAGKVLAGIGPWFDAQFLERFLRQNGQAPAWDHRLVCTKLLAVGQAQVLAEAEGDQETLDALREPPFSTQMVADVLGVDRGDSHTAFADVVTAARFYQSAMDVDLGLREALR